MPSDKKIHRLKRQTAPSLQNWKTPEGPQADKLKSNVVLECGWGRLLFGHTFSEPKALADTLIKEKRGQRDIALYIRDPHVVLSLAPHKFFLDPSHTYRLWLDQYRPAHPANKGFRIRRIQTRTDVEAMNAVYARCSMVSLDEDFAFQKKNSRTLVYLVAEDVENENIVGAVLGVDHYNAFNDPEEGSSLWALAVDPQCNRPGVGQALVRHLIEHFMARGRAFMDVSVMHSNTQAIGLYEKLGFQRVPVFCLKKKNPINEPLFMAPPMKTSLNPYAEIILNEARRRGIDVEILDAKSGLFALSFGGRTIWCRESLSELTTAVTMSLCDDKGLTRRVLNKADLKVPEQVEAGDLKQEQEFLEKHGSVVVKPARGEQGVGISVDIRSETELKKAIELAKVHCAQVLLEPYLPGRDLRVIVIDYRVVAAAVRVPPEIIGTGEHTVAQLIKKQNRRRMAATGGESKIPIDEETHRILKQHDLNLDSVLPRGQHLSVRKTANLHTGGTIHDVTGVLHSQLVDACIMAAKALKIPVVGLDLLVSDPRNSDYVIIEANERPGLANHEPQPTAQRFIDLLFPHSGDKIS